MAIRKRAIRPSSAVVKEILGLISNLAQYYKISYPFIAGTVEAESSFDPVSYRWNEEKPADRSYGLMHLTWPTASVIADNAGYSLEGNDLYDPITNLWLGILQVRWLLSQYGDYGSVAAAYNAGSLRYNSSGALINAAYVNNVLTYGQQITGIRI